MNSAPQCLFEINQIFIFVLEGMGVFGEKRPVEANAENALILSEDGDSIRFKNEKNKTCCK